MPSYWVLFFANERDASRLDNPLDPMMPGECVDIIRARTIAKAAARNMDAPFVAIEDENGKLIERWRLDNDGWKLFDA